MATAVFRTTCPQSISSARLCARTRTYVQSDGRPGAHRSPILRSVARIDTAVIRNVATVVLACQGSGGMGGTVKLRKRYRLAAWLAMSGSRSFIVSSLSAGTDALGVAQFGNGKRHLDDRVFQLSQLRAALHRDKRASPVQAHGQFQVRGLRDQSSRVVRVL